MSTRNATMTVHPALGGLDISTDPTILDPNFLTIADNVEYLESGQRKKRRGLSIYSTSTGNTNPAFLVSSSSNVRAVEDFWTYSVGGSATLTPSQNLIAVAGASIFTSTGDGKWLAQTTASSFGSNANKQTVITPAGNFVVISDETATPIAVSSSGLTNPSTGAVLTFPKFTFSVYHLNRLFTCGLSSAPSNANYTAANNIFDSTGADTGTFPVAVGDGDQLMGVSDPFYASLYFFKGPQKGSIWQLSGATSTAFSMVQVGYGAPCINPKTVITTPTDIYWMSNYGIHSLETTVKFGNVEQAFLSLPIQALWRKGIINRGAFNQAWGFWHPTRNIVGWCVKPVGDTVMRWILCFNYALSDPRPGGKKFWSIWKFPSGGLYSGGTVLTPATWDGLLGAPRGTGTPVPIFGSDSQGTVWVGDSPNVDDFGNAYTMTVQTPTITRFQTRDQGVIGETREKQFAGIVTYLNPTGNYSANVTITVDGRNTADTISLLGGGNALG